MGCMYVPHVIAVTTQTPVQVHNSDSATHNSAAITKRNGDWNETQSVGGAPVEHVFSVPEVAVALKCNMHPWMKVYVAVFSHPYFQVTGKDGSFSLKNVPPGTYTLTAWQERYGTKEQTVTVAPKSEQTVTFTFKAGGVDGDSSDDTKMSPARPTRNVHRFAVFTACCTLFLLVAGALVTSNDAGLSVPDWPLSYGSLTPPMVGGIFYEHGHRVIAACVGMLSIVLAIWLWRVEPRRLGSLAGRCGGRRRCRAGNSRRADRAVLSAPGDFFGSCRACAAVFLHDPEHRALHQFLVGAFPPGGRRLSAAPVFTRLLPLQQLLCSCS